MIEGSVGKLTAGCACEVIGVDSNSLCLFRGGIEFRGYGGSSRGLGLAEATLALPILVSLLL